MSLISKRCWLHGLFGVAALASVVVAACADGGSTDTDVGSGTTPTGAGAAGGHGGSSGGAGGGTGGEGTGGHKPNKGELGAPCAVVSDCAEGTCANTGAGKICTTECPPACPSGMYCATVGDKSLCVNDDNQQCAQCATTKDCAEPSSVCLTAPLGDKFCARDCTAMSDCPDGYACMDAADYASGSSGGSGTDGGVDGGKTDAGADASSGGSGAKVCVPKNGLSCPCGSKRAGVTHACKRTNPHGSCEGVETCDGTTKKWSGCTAGEPKAEICNGKDDNCSGQIDEGDPSALCSGTAPPNTAWTCTSGKCVGGACADGWLAYPKGDPSDGCLCKAEAGEPANNTCAGAKDAGTVADTGGELVMTGTLSSDIDVDYWKFTAKDAAEADTNSFHVAIDFTAPANNSEFVFDVMRGVGECKPAPSGPSTSLTSFDWCVDGMSGDGTKGQGTCTSPCKDFSSDYFIRVTRKAGATKTCTEYKLKVTAKGGLGRPCDFAANCMPLPP